MIEIFFSITFTLKGVQSVPACEPNASTWLNPVQTVFKNNPETETKKIAKNLEELASHLRFIENKKSSSTIFNP